MVNFCALSVLAMLIDWDAPLSQDSSHYHQDDDVYIFRIGNLNREKPPGAKRHAKGGRIDPTVSSLHPASLGPC